MHECKSIFVHAESSVRIVRRAGSPTAVSRPFSFACTDGVWVHCWHVLVGEFSSMLPLHIHAYVHTTYKTQGTASEASNWRYCLASTYRRRSLSRRMAHCLELGSLILCY